MDIKKKILIAVIALVVLALAAFLLLHDWEPKPDPRASGGPHILTDDDLHRPAEEPKEKEETEGCD